MTLTPADGQFPAGTSVPFTSTAYATGGSSTDVSSTAVLTSSNPDDVITGTSILFTMVGTRTITSTFDGVTGTASVDVGPGDLTGIDVAASAATVDQGGSVTLTVTGWDDYGNPVPIDPAEVVVTSSAPTDVIDGLTVTCPHLLTATVGELTSEVTVDVTPTPTPTPTPTSTPAALAALPATGGTD